MFFGNFDPHFEVFLVIGETKAKQIWIRRKKIARGRGDQSNVALKFKIILLEKLPSAALNPPRRGTS